MIAISRIIRISLNRERRSEDRLPDEEEEEEEEVVVMEAVAEQSGGAEVICSFNINGEQSLDKCKQLDERLEG